VRREGILLLRAAIPIMRVRKDQRRTLDFLLSFFDRAGDVRVCAVDDSPGMPAIGRETRRNVFGEAHRCRAGERDMVLIVQINQFAQVQMAGE